MIQSESVKATFIEEKIKANLYEQGTTIIMPRRDTMLWSRGKEEEKEKEPQCSFGM